MSPENNFDLPHLKIESDPTEIKYTSPLSVITDSINTIDRDRRDHGNDIKDAIQTLKESQDSEEWEDLGITITFESPDGYSLKHESLEDNRSNIELLTFQEQILSSLPKRFQDKNLNEIPKQYKKQIATIYIPENKFENFISKIDRYIEEDNRWGNPKNEKLMESIERVKKLTLDELWTDQSVKFDEFEETEKIWYEIWLRSGNSEQERQKILQTFLDEAENIDIKCSKENIIFPERTIINALASKKELIQSPNLIDCLAELRKAKTPTDWFIDLPVKEQQQWIDNTLDRLDHNENTNNYICLIDTGVNIGHSLINPFISDSDLFAFNESWGVNDQRGHGTQMAGLALYGDLHEVFQNRDAIEINHRLESVKILRNSTDHENEPYGQVTKQAVFMPEIENPIRDRLFCMAVTSPENRDQGKPSSWSASLDQLTFGTNDDLQRLLFISAGNTPKERREEYPEICEIEGIHDPAQAWNAITVGAYTNKDSVDPNKYPEWEVIASSGKLSPSSTTSVIWDKQWPNKPDLVLEGGNMGLNPETGTADYIDSLQLLTSYHRPFTKPLSVTGDTSAATALATKMAAEIRNEYPRLWPETLRALLIHTCEWSDNMTQGKDLWEVDKSFIRNELLRKYGHGVPNLTRALWSAENSLTLISENKIQPYFKDEDDYEVKTNEMHLHSLPWPVEVLKQLEDTIVNMQVTLSYFIEPDPSGRGYSGKYRYGSHGLRFDTIAPWETEQQFKERINKQSRDDSENDSYTSSDSDDWLIGKKARRRGSIHHDKWKGTARDLSQKSKIGIYPVTGWWKKRSHLEKFTKSARYSLIVSINTEKEDVDLYNPVRSRVRI